MSSSWVTSLLTALAAQIPMMLVYIGGAAIGISRWKRHPKASRLLVCAALFLAFQLLFVTILYGTMNLWLFDLDLPSGAVGWIYSGVAATSAFASALGHGVLIAAVFVERPPSP